MTVATLTEVLALAEERKAAVAGLVVLGWEDACAYAEAAEETGIPVVLQAGPGCRKHMPVLVLGKMFRHLAERARVPIVCHIDHARTVEECREGIDCGFTSVMIDGSALPIEQNIELTAKVVSMARSASVSVEGEVGVVGYSGGAASAVTSPQEAALFDRYSGADALAISVGNTHLMNEATAEIDWAALSAIEAVTQLPLVLHGGSGIPLDVRRELARSRRIRKINIGTGLRRAFGESLRRGLDLNPAVFDRIELLKATIPDVKRETTRSILPLW